MDTLKTSVMFSGNEEKQRTLLEVPKCQRSLLHDSGLGVVVQAVQEVQAASSVGMLVAVDMSMMLSVVVEAFRAASSVGMLIVVDMSMMLNVVVGAASSVGMLVVEGASMMLGVVVEAASSVGMLVVDMSKMSVVERQPRVSRIASQAPHLWCALLVALSRFLAPRHVFESPDPARGRHSVHRSLTSPAAIRPIARVVLQSRSHSPPKVACRRRPRPPRTALC